MFGEDEFGSDILFFNSNINFINIAYLHVILHSYVFRLKIRNSILQ